jgi:hypothetical protein
MLLAFAIGRLLGAVLRRAALRLARRTRFTWDDRLVEAAIGPARLLLGIAVFAAALRALHLSVPPRLAIEGMLRSLTIVAFTWAGLRGVGFVAWLIEDRFARGTDPARPTRDRTEGSDPAWMEDRSPESPTLSPPGA